MHVASIGRRPVVTTRQGFAHPICRAGFGGFGAKKGVKQQQTAKPPDDKACPCGSGLDYKGCCLEMHKFKLRPAAVTPEVALRARYSAMALSNAYYLKETNHPDNPALKGSDTDPATGAKKHCSYEEDLAVTLRSIKLKRLELLSPAAIDEQAGRATIDYAYSYKRVINDRGAKIKAEQPLIRRVERATFLRNEGQRWLLLDSVEAEPPKQQQAEQPEQEQQEQQQPEQQQQQAQQQQQQQQAQQQ